MPEIGEIRKSKEIGKRGWNKFIWIACPTCGKQRWVFLSRGKPQYEYCRSCIPSHKPGIESRFWKGGRNKNSLGYIDIWVGKDDFFYLMADKRGYIKEHRLVMAKHLGRCLHSWEIVHHKNHVRDDNRIENLQLVSDDRHRQITILENKIDRLLERQDKLLQGQTELKQELRLLRFENQQLRERCQ